jgi:PKD repeat protein
MKKTIISLLCFTGIFSHTITIKAQSCTATIQYAITPINKVTFTAVGNFYPTTTFSWYYGDGTCNLSVGPINVKHYVSPQSYNVVLVVSDTIYGCSDTVRDTILLPNYNSPCPTAFNFTSVDTFLTLYTINRGVPPYSYLWQLPDGSTSTLPDPTYTISSTGSYPGNVMVIDSTGCSDTVSYVLTNGNFAGNDCRAYFYVEPDSTTGVYTAVDCSLGFGVNYEWDFGDGDTSTLQYPSHVYTVPGYYTICLNISSATCHSRFCNANFYAFKNNNGTMSQISVISKAAATGLMAIPYDTGFSIYPNPASSSLNVNVSGDDKIISSTIYDARGQKILELGSSNFLSVRQFTIGLYLIEVKTNKSIYRSAFIRQE